MFVYFSIYLFLDQLELPFSLDDAKRVKIKGTWKWNIRDWLTAMWGPWLMASWVTQSSMVGHVLPMRCASHFFCASFLLFFFWKSLMFMRTNQFSLHGLPFRSKKANSSDCPIFLFLFFFLPCWDCHIRWPPWFLRHYQSFKVRPFSIIFNHHFRRT